MDVEWNFNFGFFWIFDRVRRIKYFLFFEKNGIEIFETFETNETNMMEVSEDKMEWM